MIGNAAAIGYRTHDNPSPPTTKFTLLLGLSRHPESRPSHQSPILSAAGCVRNKSILVPHYEGSETRRTNALVASL